MESPLSRAAVPDTLGVTTEGEHMSWQGVLVTLAFVALLVIGFLARRWSRNLARKAEENFRTGMTADRAGIAFVDKKVAGLATVAHFDASVATVAPALAGIKLPMFWKHPEPTVWLIEIAAGDPTPSTLAVLEPDGSGSRLALVRSSDGAGIPMDDATWRKLRTRAVEAARAAGITVSEHQGPDLVRTPRVDTTGMAPGVAANAPHFFERPGYFPGPPVG